MADGHGHKHTLDDGHKHGDGAEVKAPSRKAASVEPAADAAAPRKHVKGVHSADDGHGHGPLALKNLEKKAREEGRKRHKSALDTTAI